VNSLMQNLDPTPGPAGPDQRRRPGPSKRAAIYKADTWHVSDGTASDGSGRPPSKNPVRRVFTAEYKLAVLAEYDTCSESGEKGAILRREGLYSSLITDWRRQHRQGLLKAAVGRSDGGRGGPSLSEVARLRAENERLRTKLAQAEVIIDVQGKVHALLEEISKSAAPDDE
jgi:transposase